MEASDFLEMPKLAQIVPTIWKQLRTRSEQQRQTSQNFPHFLLLHSLRDFLSRLKALFIFFSTHSKHKIGFMLTLSSSLDKSSSKMQ